WKFLFGDLFQEVSGGFFPFLFSPLVQEYQGTATSITILEEDVSQMKSFDLNEEKFAMMARFQPLLSETMSKSKNGFLGVSNFTLSGLRNWIVPDKVLRVFSARQFHIFLPPKEDLKLGEPWWIIFKKLREQLPSNRFYPPMSKKKEDLIYKLLSMFHPRLFVKTRFGPQGAVACLMATSESYYTVAFRIHAEFQLNEPPLSPFWFSPGQFTGHVILSKDSSHVRDFRLFVPNHKPLNVEMEWLYKDEENGSFSSDLDMDTGYLPQMELESWGPSIPTEIYQKGKIIYRRLCEQSRQFEDIVWQQAISWEKAVQQLEVAMYPFLEVTYLPFAEAFKQAKAENKLVHFILLWGSLDDQSCFGPGQGLRDIILGNSQILTLLKNSFISSWSQVHELNEIQNNHNNESHKKLAQLILEKYDSHVKMLLCLPNGTVVCTSPFVDDLSKASEEIRSDDTGCPSNSFVHPVTIYEEFLQEGLFRAQSFLHV
uniref:Selenoprotein N n=1 Tax=Monodelphis domestica TaxID=13616 RepID=F6U275_MONDO